MKLIACLVAFSCSLRRDKLDGSGIPGGAGWLGSFQLCAPPRRARRKLFAFRWVYPNRKRQLEATSDGASLALRLSSSS